MTTYEELDTLHREATHMAVQIAVEMVWMINGRVSREAVAKLGARLDTVMSTFAFGLHTLLQREGFDTSYQPHLVGDKGVIKVYLSSTFYHTIVIAVHPSHNTLIYYNDPPYMGSTRELIQNLHACHGRELAKQRCSGCHYINTELWVCGIGKALDIECREYIAISES
jgi:hypothetical protein